MATQIFYFFFFGEKDKKNQKQKKPSVVFWLEKQTAASVCSYTIHKRGHVCPWKSQISCHVFWFVFVSFFIGYFFQPSLRQLETGSSLFEADTVDVICFVVSAMSPVCRCEQSVRFSGSYCGQRAEPGSHRCSSTSNLPLKAPMCKSNVIELFPHLCGPGG